MNKIRRFRKNKIVTKKKLNKLKSAVLKISLIMLNFIFATFAWFTYTRILESNVDVNVSAWQVDFKDTSDASAVLGTSMQFQVGNFYPGMNDYTKEIEIINLGDRAANITYKIEELKILGHTYQIKGAPEEGDSERTVYKSEVTDNVAQTKTIKLLNDSDAYPFEIIITHSLQIDINSDANPNQNKGTFKICFTWPYNIVDLPAVLPDDLPEELTEEAEILEELNQRKNILDTQWGEDIAEYYNNQPAGTTPKGIEIKVQAIAQQII